MQFQQQLQLIKSNELLFNYYLSLFFVYQVYYIHTCILHVDCAAPYIFNSIIVTTIAIIKQLSHLKDNRVTNELHSYVAKSN